MFLWTCCQLLQKVSKHRNASSYVVYPVSWSLSSLLPWYRRSIIEHRCSGLLFTALKSFECCWLEMFSLSPMLPAYLEGFWGLVFIFLLFALILERFEKLFGKQCAVPVLEKVLSLWKKSCLFIKTWLKNNNNFVQKKILLSGISTMGSLNVYSGCSPNSHRNN